MEALLASTAFKVYASVSAVLGLKLLLIAFATAGVRGKKNVYVNPEDAKFFKADQGADHDTVQRLKRLHANSVENEVLFMVLGLLYLLLGASQFGMQVYAYTFLILRLVHALAYLRGMQPLRSGVWVLSALCLLGMVTQILMACFG